MASKTIEIVQGQDATITVSLTDKQTAQPFPLTGFSGATAYFAADAGGALPATGSLVSADCGRLAFQLTEVETALLRTGDSLDIEVVVDQGAQRTIAQILGRLTVAPRLFT